MDELLIVARDAKESCAFQGSTEEFRRSPELVDWCIKHRRIIRLSPQEMSREERERYTDYLAELMREYLKAHPEVKNWSAFASRSGTNKVQALFHQFGVRGEVFGIESFQEEELEQPARPQTNLTIEEFYEMCQIQFHYEGSLGSFKKIIARRYGSFAEYCISRGYDINGTKWESDETAIRVAGKLGSLGAIEQKSISLFKYLQQRDLVDGLFQRRKTLC